MIILVDMDGPLADIETGFLNDWRRRHPDAFWVPIEERRHFFLEDDYPAELGGFIREVFDSRGFFRNLPAVPQGLAAVRKMLDMGHNVQICTTPTSTNPYCNAEKYDWINEHLGPDFHKRVIYSHDKTLVRGRLLIDDKPEIHGAMTPEWEHILFDCRPKSAKPEGKRIISADWSNWEDIINNGR